MRWNNLAEMQKQEKCTDIEIMNAYEKQIPKKPIILGAIGMEIDDSRSCPSCYSSLCAYEGENYCMKCGQKLDR